MNVTRTLKRLSAFVLIGSTAAFTAAAAEAPQAQAKADSAAACAGKSKNSEGAKRGWLGIAAINSRLSEDKDHRGKPEVKITRVLRGSPAEKAGLKEGDILWKFDGRRLTNTAQLRRELRDEKPGTAVPVEIYRGDKAEDLSVTLGTHHMAAWRLHHHLRHATA